MSSETAFRQRALEIARQILRREAGAGDDFEAVHLLEIELQKVFDAGRQAREKEERHE